MLRKEISTSELNEGVMLLQAKLLRRLEQKGYGAHASSHEILGILEEELLEYKMAVHGNLTKDEKVDELLDIAVGCLFGIASIRSDKVDW